jgi:hypothetical protein
MTSIFSIAANKRFTKGSSLMTPFALIKSPCWISTLLQDLSLLRNVLPLESSATNVSAEFFTDDITLAVMSNGMFVVMDVYSVFARVDAFVIDPAYERCAANAQRDWSKTNMTSGSLDICAEVYHKPPLF